MAQNFEYSSRQSVLGVLRHGNAIPQVFRSTQPLKSVPQCLVCQDRGSFNGGSSLSNSVLTEESVVELEGPPMVGSACLGSSGYRTRMSMMFCG